MRAAFLKKPTKIFLSGVFAAQHGCTPILGRLVLMGSPETLRNGSEHQVNSVAPTVDTAGRHTSGTCVRISRSNICKMLDFYSHFFPMSF